MYPCFSSPQIHSNSKSLIETKRVADGPIKAGPDNKPRLCDEAEPDTRIS